MGLSAQRSSASRRSGPSRLMGFPDWILLILATFVAGQIGLRAIALFMPHVPAAHKVKPTVDGFAVCHHCRDIMPNRRAGDG